MHIYSVFNKLFQVEQEKINNNTKVNKEKPKEQGQYKEKPKEQYKGTTTDVSKNNCYALFPKDGNCFLGLYNKEKKLFQLEGLGKFSSNKYWIKKANEFLSDKLTKQMVYLDIVDKSGDKDLVIVYLDKEKKRNINQELLVQDFTVNALKYQDDKKIDIIDSKVEKRIDEKVNLNNCYALFPKDGCFFLAMFNNEKRTFKLSGCEYLIENKLWIKKSTEYLKEKLSKKMVYLDFPSKDEPDLVTVYLDKWKTKDLNQDLLDQDFSKNIVIKEIVEDKKNVDVVKSTSLNNSGSWGAMGEDFFDDMLEDYVEDKNNEDELKDIIKSEPLKNSGRWSSTDLVDEVSKTNNVQSQNKTKRFPK